MACYSSGGGERDDDAREGRGGEEMGEGVLFVKVMTDEQMEILRRQIAAYATICEQLVEMHKAITSHRDSLAGMRLGGLYNDPLITSSAQRIAARQRWTPTTMQLQMLEAMFNEGNGTPTKQKIKQITSELSQHGQISESNVYNWFQNRRARSKKKQMVALTCNTESEVEADEESPDEKKPRHNYHHESMPLDIDNSCYIRQLDDEVHSLAPQPNQTLGVYRSNDGLKPSGTLEHLTYENILSMPRFEQLMDKFDMQTSFSPYNSGENYDIMD